MSHQRYTNNKFSNGMFIKRAIKSLVALFKSQGSIPLIMQLKLSTKELE